MKIVTQVGIIFSICWISQIIEKLLPFSFPASVIGMILLFILLCVHILKVDHIREKSDFLLENMAFFFIPAGVSIIILAYHRIKPHVPPLVRAPVNSFEVQPCDRTPQVGCLMLSLGR